VISISTYTNTHTYTRTRLGVIDAHMELFLTCAELSKSDIEKLLDAVDDKEISAVGIYIVDEGHRIAEVEFGVDWNKHEQMIGIYGTRFDTNIPGWKDDVSPEAYVVAQRLVLVARRMRKKVHSWIRVAPAIPRGSARYKAICDKLGYGGTVPSWKENPTEENYSINGLPEAKVAGRTTPFEL
jgi:hypothetical protein